MIFSVQKPFSYDCMEVHGDFFLRDEIFFFYYYFTPLRRMPQLILVKAFVVSKFPVLEMLEL